MRSAVNHNAPDHTVIAASAASDAPVMPQSGTSQKLAATSVATVSYTHLTLPTNREV